MTRNTKSYDTSIQALLTAFLVLLMALAGCGQTQDERHAQKEAERKDHLQKERQEKQRQIAGVEREFNAIYFPPPEIEATSFTYEIQKFFEVHKEDTIVFEGHLEDIEASENNVLVEFLYPIGSLFFGTKIAIRFRLTATESNIDELLEAKRRNTLFSLNHRYYIDGPDFLVIAKINDIQRVRMYEFGGSANGEEVKIQAEDSKGLVASGHLIKAIPKSKEDEGRP